VLGFFLQTELFEQRLSTEDPELLKHLRSIGAWRQLPCQRWFDSFFAEDLHDPSLERYFALQKEQTYEEF
jgi:hypothetical protein